MSIAMIQKVLLWCAFINYGVLLVWFLFFMLAHDWMYQLHGRWFHLSVEQFDALHYAGMALYKIGILLCNLIPSIALRIVERADSHCSDTPCSRAAQTALPVRSTHYAPTLTFTTHRTAVYKIP